MSNWPVFSKSQKLREAKDYLLDSSGNLQCPARSTCFVDKQMDAVDGQTRGWTDGCVGRWADGWIDGQNSLQRNNICRYIFDMEKRGALRDSSSKSQHLLLRLNYTQASSTVIAEKTLNFIILCPHDSHSESRSGFRGLGNMSLKPCSVRIHRVLGCTNGQCVITLRSDND